MLRHVYPAGLHLDRLWHGLAKVAAALNRNDQYSARIAAVHLKIPDLPNYATRDGLDAVDCLIKYARAEGTEWNPALHPRAGTPPNPGWFTPTGAPSEYQSAAHTAQNANENHSLVIPIADNRRENKQFRDIVVALGLNKDQAQQLHRAISGMGYNYHEILEIAKDMFGK